MVARIAAIDLGASRGLAVLQLLERAQVSPLPAFYRLLYDYVAGVQGLFSSRVGDILAEGERGSDAVGERLYAEFVEPYERTEAVDRAIARMTERLVTLDLLIGESARASQAQSASLRDATAQFAEPQIDAALLKDWVARLHATNETMRDANASLGRELQEAQVELKTTHAEIQLARDSMSRDPLTGLANRAGLDVELTRILGERREQQTDLACAVVDIDHFKSLNDRYGHQVGDEVLRIVSRALLVSVRDGDLVGRPGGDEFLVVFPKTGLAAAHEMSDRIRRAIVENDLRAVLGNGVLGGITVSIGVAVFQTNDTISRLVDRADRCLFAAKGAGRNRVTAEEELAA
ncbi:MAG: GGDEF domain-containing protein [Devosia sp.]